MREIFLSRRSGRFWNNRRHARVQKTRSIRKERCNARERRPKPRRNVMRRAGKTAPWPVGKYLLDGIEVSGGGATSPFQHSILSGSKKDNAYLATDVPKRERIGFPRKLREARPNHADRRTIRRDNSRTTSRTDGEGGNREHVSWLGNRSRGNDYADLAGGRSQTARTRGCLEAALRQVTDQPGEGHVLVGVRPIGPFSAATYALNKSKR